MEKNKIIKMGMIMTLIFFISFTSAFSVSAPYMENKELVLPLGENIKSLEFVLQNSGAPENINVRARILEGSEIINITDASNIYTVIPGDKVPVHFEINVPEESQIGDAYLIRLGFSTEKESQSGAFGFGTEIEQKFNVTIGEKIQPPAGETSNNSLYIILGLVLAIILIIFFIKKKIKK